MDIGQPPIAWIDRPPARERERQIGAPPRQPLDEVQPLLLDEAADEQHDTSDRPEVPVTPEPCALSKPAGGSLKTSVSTPLKISRGGALKRTSRKAPGHGRADEHDLIGGRQHRPGDQRIGGAP